MTKTLITLTIAAIMALTSCSGSSNAGDSTTATNDTTGIDLDLPNGTPGLAKRIIDEDLFIDIDSAAIEETLNAFNICSRRQVLGEDIPAVEITDRINDNISKIKAATYRFSSSLSVVDKQMVLKSGTTAGTLKMSDDIFNRMKADIDQSNEFFRRQAEAGDSVQVPDISEEYLNSLLE